MAKIVFDNITKIYPNGVCALKNFSVEIDEGEFLVMVGPSGCGKSTALRIIAGLEDITEGSLMFDEVRVNEMSPKDRNTAMVFQNYALYPTMTVYENMALGLKLRKLPKNEIKERITEVAERLGISDLLKRKPKTLSGGQQQRVALGRAMVKTPSVFLFDEPLSNIDAKLRGQMRVEISKLYQTAGATFVYVTHDQVEAMSMGTKIAVINKGELQQLDTPWNIYNRPVNKFVAGFIGAPSMNFLQAEVCEQDGRAALKILGREQIYMGQSPLDKYVCKKVWAGIRPENMRISENGTEGKLEVSELLGSEEILYVSIGEERVAVKIPARSQTQKENTVKIDFDIDKVHLFDWETEMRI